MNTTPKQKKPWLTPAGRIVLSAIAIGYVSGVSGCLGGILLFPDNNMAPILFVPFGGIGIAVGICLGIAWSAFKKDGHSLRTELWWIVMLWALTVLVTFKLDCNILFVSLQALPLLLGILVMNHKRLRPNIPEGVRRCRFLYPITALLFLITSLFPPVTHNKWMPIERRPVYTESNPMPKFVFCNSPRLDASRSYAELSVAGHKLLTEWGVITIGNGLLLIWLHTDRRRK